MGKRKSDMTPDEHRVHLEKRRARYGRMSSEQKSRHAKTLRENYDRRKASGVCVACTDLAITGLLCMYHWLVNVGRVYGLTVNNGGTDALRRQFEHQGGLCALTGDRLIPGQNASIDHVIPQSRGGTNDPANLQWVTKQANNAKYNLTNDEFVEMCRKVVSARGNVVAIKKAG